MYYVDLNGKTARPFGIEVIRYDRGLLEATCLAS